MLDASRKYATSPISIDVITLSSNIQKQVKTFPTCAGKNNL